MSEEHLDEVFIKTNQDYQNMTQTIQSSRQKFEETKNTKRELDDEIRQLENEILMQKTVLKAKNIPDPESRTANAKIGSSKGEDARSDSKKEFNYFDHILGNRDSSDIVIFGDDPWKVGEPTLRNKIRSSAKRADGVYDKDVLHFADIGISNKDKRSSGSDKRVQDKQTGKKKSGWFCC